MDEQTVNLTLENLKRAGSVRAKEEVFGSFSTAFYNSAKSELFRELIMEIRNGLFRELAQQKQINELKDQFVFVAAHDLRSPVTAIKLSLEFLEQQKIPADLKEVFYNIKEANSRLNNLVGDLLNVARLESGKMRIELQEFKVDEEVKKILKEMKLFAGKNKITLNYEISDKNIKLFSDPQRLKEVLANLLTNAVKYNKENGKVYLDIKKEGNKIHFAVKDTGIGLSSDDQKHIFEKFWRSDEVRQKEGTGLGLFIVKEIVEKLGGKIWFESKKNSGTTFYFTLPIAKI